MKLSELIGTIYEGILTFMPLFRMVWAGTVVLGIVMIVTAFVLKKNPIRKKSPWIVGGIGLLMVISPGTQLLASLL